MPPVRRPQGVGHVLVAGVSTRAMAASAAAAGYDVTAVDGYADADQAARVRAIGLQRDHGVPFTPAAAARVAASIASDAVAYTSNFDNHPYAVATLTAGRTLWGNPPDVLRRVRRPTHLAEVVRAAGLPSPLVTTAAAASSEHEWMIKPRASGGGHGVRPWRRGEPVPAGWYLQQRVAGASGSVVFVAAGGRALVLGVTTQLIGDAAFGVSGFRYCGNILTWALGQPVPAARSIVHERIVQLTDAIVRECGLEGVGGIDFIEHEAWPYPVEVNPRWTAAMELIERMTGLSVFAVHAAACGKGELPAPDAASDQGGGRAGAGSVSGKAVVFARQHVVTPDTDGWLADTTVADVPRSGEPMPAGSPVCTIFATGQSVARCYTALVARAADVYAALIPAGERR